MMIFIAVEMRNIFMSNLAMFVIDILDVEGKVAKRTRLIITPATQKIALQAQKGLVDIFIEAGAVFSNPTCGACLGGYMGILGKGERCVATTNRNFVGRMGDRTSRNLPCQLSRTCDQCGYG